MVSGAVDQRYVSVFDRFLPRAPWSRDAVGRVLFTLARARVPAEQPLFLLVDDPLTCQHGKGIGAAPKMPPPVWADDVPAAA